MQAKIKSLHLENFKGVKSADGKREATYNFEEKNVSVIGQNGAGKSTIEAAYFWVMVDKDEELKSNPDIRPLDTEECTPSVEIVFDIDGTEVVVEKIQKIKKKEYEKNGKPIVEISSESSYKVNHAPMGLAQFKKKMATYGVDFDRFLHLSHPDAFTNQMSTKKDMEKMRDTMFEMTQTYTDLKIAEILGNVPEAAELLKINTKDEIRATQNDALREIRENYGKDGEILRAKIAGLEQSKEDIDVAELELLKNSLNEQIAENKAKQEDISKEFEEQQKASDGILELQFELNDLQKKANEENNKKRLKIQNELDKLNGDYDKFMARASGIRSRIKSDTEEGLPLLEQRLKEKQQLWKSVNAEQIDENKYICPTCHRELPEEEKENILSNFEEMKKQRLEFIVSEGERASQAVKDKKKYIEDSKKEAEEYEKKQEETLKKIEELESQLSELPDSIDISDRPEVQEIQRQIAEKEAAMNKGNSAEEIRQKLKDEAEELQKQMDKVNEQFALAKKNIWIDEDILTEREKQKWYEQSKADAERILDQLDMISKKKNELLTDEVNSHFKLVKFRLFNYLKNGTIVDDCTPTIDGKSINDHSNGALRVLAKLDIIAGLQKFYGQYYPVFVDDFALVTDNTECRIDMDCQLIKLVAEKGVKELKIEMEG